MQSNDRVVIECSQDPVKVDPGHGSTAKLRQSSVVLGSPLRSRHGSGGACECSRQATQDPLAHLQRIMLRLFEIKVLTVCVSTVAPETLK